jgi:hypothetical protein
MRTALGQRREHGSIAAVQRRTLLTTLVRALGSAGPGT